MPQPPRDVAGTVIRAGDRVRVLGLPDLSGMTPRGRRESRRLFERIQGTCRRVVGVNEIGWLELAVRIRAGPEAGLHTVWIEPRLLRVCRTRE